MYLYCNTSVVPLFFVFALLFFGRSAKLFFGFAFLFVGFAALVFLFASPFLGSGRGDVFWLRVAIPGIRGATLRVRVTPGQQSTKALHTVLTLTPTMAK